MVTDKYRYCRPTPVSAQTVAEYFATAWESKDAVDREVFRLAPADWQRRVQGETIMPGTPGRTKQ